MEDWIGAVAIVTGASSGIGEAIAIELVKKGLKVVGLARRIDRLNNLKEHLENELGEFYPIKCDMTKEEEILAAFEWIKNTLGSIALLVNNAGYGKYTTLSEGTTSDWKSIFDVNVMGLCIATREAIKNMTENNTAGLIVHMNSIFGHLVPTTCAETENVYIASKYCVTALAETLRLELAKSKAPIRVSSISPGIVDTGLIAAGGFTDDHLTELYNRVPPLKPVDIANAVLYILSTPRNVNVTELTIRPAGEIL
ncbi:farnesol dehydrogenase-like [Chrysoperla carnea]|uniref:farnesol dehydrogenase-like n=1 Tax=Chrysoperla carnea TaxID=189513 RepID=UPI001D096AAE|nr:farnesol dehydrogenase-like [Chrysoperla carnea]